MFSALCLRIADLHITIEWPPALGGLCIPQAYRPFIARGGQGVRLQLSTEPPPGDRGASVFQSPPIWSLHSSPDGLQYRIYESYPELRRTLAIEGGGGSARLSLQGANRDPFIGPTLELMTIARLAENQGVILHGCGIACGGQGIVFAGESGAGKSTLARLWAAERGVDILSDDRVIVRRQNGRYRLYGTPWHGDEAFAAPGGVELRHIFFIRHGPNNQIKRLSAPGAVREMLKCSFPPLWDARGTAAALELFHGAAASVPCVELSFAPERAAVEFVRDALNGG